MPDKLAAPPGRKWRPWTIWLPGALGVAISGLLILADGFAGVLASWGAISGLRWLTAGMIGHGVLAAASVLVLGAGLSYPSRRRAAAITAWAIILAGCGWFLLTILMVRSS
jgi:hypothetical protein